MPTFRITAPDGTKYNVTGPDGSTAEQALAQVQAQHQPAPAHVNSPAMTAKIDGDQISQDAKAGPSVLGEIVDSSGRFLRDSAAAVARGAGSIGATLINASSKLPTSDAQRNIQRGAGDEVTPVASGAPTLSSLITGQKPISADEQRRQDMDSALASMGADTTSPTFKTVKALTEIAGTAGAGSAVAGTLRAAPVVAAWAPNLLQAIRTGGMSANAGTAAGAGNILTRVAGGAVNGGASAGLVDPSTAGTGAVVGGALPVVTRAAGAAGNAIGNLVRGPEQTPEVAAAVEAARKAGYVIPPTQASPTLFNRALEGFSGKLTTAQNASAANAATTNKIAAEAIGLPSDTVLSPGVLDKVRAEAGAAYSDVAKLGKLDANGAKLPQGVNVTTATDPLTMKRMSTVDSAELVRAWKQANSDATGYYRAYARDANPETLAKAKAAASDAKSVDDFLQKSLTTATAASHKTTDQLLSELSSGYISKDEFMRQALGKGDDGSAGAALLDALKAARVRIAKTYSIESAMNAETGTVDAKKLAAQLQKGKVLSDGLKDAGTFAARFPKAAQTPEAMGSLPGTSPLDWAVGGSLSAATANPLALAAVAGRPAARYLALSPVVQNRLVQQRGPNALQALIAANPDLAMLGYRAAPSALTDR